MSNVKLKNSMTPEQFVYWLRGIFQVVKGNQLNKEQIDLIRNTLELVYEENFEFVEAPKNLENIYGLIKDYEEVPEDVSCFNRIKKIFR